MRKIFEWSLLLCLWTPFLDAHANSPGANATYHQHLVTRIINYDLLFAEKGTEDRLLAERATRLNLPMVRTFDARSLGTVSPLFSVYEDEFLPEGFDPGSTNADTLDARSAEALGLEQLLDEEDRYVDYISSDAVYQLPLGIKKTLAGIVYKMVVDEIRLYADHAELDAYLLFEVPQNGKKLIFFGRGLKFTNEGGIYGDARLELIGNFAIGQKETTQLVLSGGDINKPQEGSNTYAIVSCGGFESLHVEADLFFSKNLLRKELPNGNLSEDQVSAHFTTDINDWNDILVSFSLPNFQVTGLKGFTFNVSEAVFDFSDVRNAPGTIYPQGYFETYYAGVSPELWRGVYLRAFEVTLPAHFQDRENSSRVKFGAYDALLDKRGFSGTLAAQNLIPIERGAIGKWAFSLDEIRLSLTANQIKSGGFRGKLELPLAKKDTSFLLGYTAAIQANDQYTFSVATRQNLEFDLWKANVNLYESSFVELELINGDLRTRANLSGKMTINASLDDSGEQTSGEASQKNKVILPELEFQNLEIRSYAPYIQIGSFDLGSKKSSEAGKFPITLNSIGATSQGDQIELKVGVTLHLTGEGDNGFGAEGNFRIKAEEISDGDLLGYRFKGIEVERFALDVNGGPFSFSGELILFKNDRLYGNGISGQVSATFDPGFSVEAKAVFGSVDGYRYWFVDAMAEMNSGIPIFTGVGLYGFGGGAYHHMKISNVPVNTTIGQSLSGITYIPDSKAGLGLKATVKLGTHPDPKAFNGEATFEMAFFDNGKLRYISFKGIANFVTAPIPIDVGKFQDKISKLAKVASDLANTANDATGGLLAQVSGEDQYTEEIYGAPENSGSAITASLFISYDFENRALHGNFSVNIDAVVLTGGGEVVIHYEPSKWYVYIGRPEYDKRIGLKFLGIAEAGSYFVMGSEIPGSPPPPDELQEIVGDIDLDYMSDLNALGTGGGIGFGSYMKFDTGDLTFLIFYARFQAGLGFDVMIKNYGPNVRCKGREAGDFGIDGWYANGQAYAYFDGSVGIKVKIMGKKKKIEIFGGGAAVVLQAKLPNPTWMRGIVTGRFNVLGGLVKGKFDFEVVIGEECELVGGSVLEGVDVIASVTPSENASDVDVFTAPQAVFNMAVNHNFEMVDVDDIRKTFRIKLDKFELKSGGTKVEGQLEWNADNTSVAFNSLDILPGKSDVSLIVQVSFEERKGGTWQTVLADDGTPIIEKEEVKFATGEAPDHIPLSNVAYSYPMINQKNYYKEQTHTGYIKLIKGQPDLFSPGPEWNQVALVRDANGNEKPFTFSYTAAEREIVFTMPEGLSTSNVYEVAIVNRPKEANVAVDANVKKQTRNVEGASEVDVETRYAEGSIERREEKNVYSAFFSTSRYPTVEAKLNAITFKTGFRWLIANGIHQLIIPMEAVELFDKYEISGSPYTDPLINLTADMSGNTWYNSRVYPMIYEGYPYAGLTINHRSTSSFGGVPPLKAVFIAQENEEAVLTDQEINTASALPVGGLGSLSYELPTYFWQDYWNLQTQAAARALQSSSSRVDRLFNPFPPIIDGLYKFTFQYKLPGRSTVLFNKTFSVDLR